MNALLVFFGFIILIFVVVSALQIRNKKGFYKFISNKELPGILAGIGYAFVAIVCISILLTFFIGKAEAQEWSYFNYIELDVGLVATKNVSPQCEEYSDYNKWTSDIRLRLNAARYVSQGGVIWAELNGEYLHHSCQLGEDRFSFDSLGPKATMRWNF